MIKNLPAWFLIVVWVGLLIYSSKFTGEQMWWFLGAGTLIGICWYKEANKIEREQEQKAGLDEIKKNTSAKAANLANTKCWLLYENITTHESPQGRLVCIRTC